MIDAVSNEFYLKIMNGATGFNVTSIHWIQLKISRNRWIFFSNFAINRLLVLKKDRFTNRECTSKQNALIYLVEQFQVCIRYRLIGKSGVIHLNFCFNRILKANKKMLLYLFTAAWLLSLSLIPSVWYSKFHTTQLFCQLCAWITLTNVSLLR